MSILQKINYKIYPPEQLDLSAPQVVLLHGLMGSATNWMKISNLLMKGFRVLAFDQRAHGQSWHPASGFTSEDFAGDLLELLDALEWERPHLLGHSMGGRNAIVFAANNPSRVNKLVIEDIGPDADQMNVDRMHRLLAAIPTPFVDRKSAQNYFFKEFSSGPGLEFDNPMILAKYLYSNLRKADSGIWNWRFSKSGILDAVREGRGRERWDEWKKLSCPVLLMRGERSEVLSDAVYQRMLQEQPLATGQLFADSGHWIHYEQPEMFVKTLVEFFGN